MIQRIYSLHGVCEIHLKRNVFVYSSFMTITWYLSAFVWKMHSKSSPKTLLIHLHGYKTVIFRICNIVMKVSVTTVSSILFECCIGFGIDDTFRAKVWWYLSQMLKKYFASILPFISKTLVCPPVQPLRYPSHVVVEYFHLCSLDSGG